MSEHTNIDQFCSDFLAGKYLAKDSLEDVSFLNDTDLESIVMRYAHGDCHAWTIALVECDFKLNIHGLYADGQIIHSCLSNGTIYLDATGIHTEDALLSTWKFITGVECEVEQLSHEEVYRLIMPMCDEIAEAQDNIAIWLKKASTYLKN